MSELVFEDVSMEINKVAIANNLTFYATRLCCIFFSPDCGTFKELSLLFSKIHLHSANEIKVRGSVYFDGKVLPAAKFHHLLNQHVVCEGNDSVFDVLSLINREEAENMVRKLDIYFYNKRTDHLNVQESRIFEIAVNLIAKPPVMYLKVLGMSRKQKDKCLSILSEFVQQHESVVFVETEFSDIFDCAVIVKHEKILSLSRQESSRFFESRELSVFSLPSNPIKGDSADKFVSEINLNKTDEPYNYKKLFMAYKTSNTVDLKHVNMPTWNRLTTIDFYKVGLTQAAVLGYKKYEMTFQKHEKRMGVLKSLFPCFLLIFVLRLANELTDKPNIQHAPDLVALTCSAILNKNDFPMLATFFLQTFVLKGFSLNKIRFLLKKFFRERFSEVSQRLIFASVCFSVMYQYSSIFEEDFQALNYNINVLMTPGTYIASIFIFAALAHISTFCFVGWIFNIRLMTLNLICAFFINLICFSFLGKRLRTTFIGFFISTCLFSALVTAMRSGPSIILKMFYAIFPLLIYSQELVDGGYPVPSTLSLAYVLLYCTVIYIITCYRISFY